MARLDPNEFSDPIARNALSLFHLLEDLDLPKGTRMRSIPRDHRIEITEPGKAPYFLETPRS